MTVHLQIYGRVQGVFFRRSAKVEADKLGLAGWARNDNDGSVHVLAVGEEGKLKEFIKWCKDGPEMAKVDKIKERWTNNDENLSGFEVID